MTTPGNPGEPVPDPDDAAKTSDEAEGAEADLTSQSHPLEQIPREVLDPETLDALNNVDPDELIGPVANEEARKGNAYEPSAWLHSPAHLELLAMANSRLTQIANIQRIEDEEPLLEQVDHVWVRLVPGTLLVVIKAVPCKNLTALPVVRYKGGSSAWVNLFPLLGPHGLARTRGFRERFDVLFVPKKSPLWPALFIDLGKALDRRREPSRKKGKDGEGK